MKKEQMYDTKKGRLSILRAVNIFKHEPASATLNARALLNQESVEAVQAAQLEAELAKSLAIYNMQKMNRVT